MLRIKMETGKLTGERKPKVSQNNYPKQSDCLIETIDASIKLNNLLEGKTQNKILLNPLYTKPPFNTNGSTDVLGELSKPVLHIYNYL